VLDNNQTTCQLAKVGRLKDSYDGPPKDMNFYLVMGKLKIPWHLGITHGYVLFVETVILIPISIYLGYVVVHCLYDPGYYPYDEKVYSNVHYALFGLFGILLMIFDLLRNCCCCCKRPRKLYTPNLSKKR